MGACTSTQVEQTPPNKQAIALYMTTALEKIDAVRKRLQDAKTKLEVDEWLPENYRDIQRALFLSNRITLLEMHEHLNKLDDLVRRL